MQSPDLIPIERFWDELEHKQYLTSVSDLTNALVADRAQRTTATLGKKKSNPKPFQKIRDYYNGKDEHSLDWDVQQA